MLQDFYAIDHVIPLYTLWGIYQQCCAIDGSQTLTVFTELSPGNVLIKSVTIIIIFALNIWYIVHVVEWMVETLRYMPEGHGFDS
jgi:hypothetical protein